MSRSMSTSSRASQAGLLDQQFESLIDLSEYDNTSYHSPTLSPAAADKVTFVRPAKIESAPTSLLSASQPLSGPSHQYDLYKQQTGIVPGAMASTLALNPHSSFANFGMDYVGIGSSEDVFDFNTAPSASSLTNTNADMDMEFDSPNNDFFFESTVNPSSIGGQEAHGLPATPVMPTSNVGRLWPGMHQQAALAKAQAEQRPQQPQATQNPPAGQAKGKAGQASDPMMEQKITQLLNSMRARQASAGDGGVPLVGVSRPRRDEDDMDEDERLLASDEGKKLSSKERRQLRNKVSARAFRSRRKEYISQLESEIASKVTENGDLRAQNRALTEENKRLTDLTHMLLSSPSFSDFLNNLSTNPQQVPQPQPAPHVQPVPKTKDVNPYVVPQQLQQQQQIGVAMMPEHHMDLSMLSIDGGFSYQPQVYTVATPEPAMDLSMLSGKTCNYAGEPEPVDADGDKAELPMRNMDRRPGVEAIKPVAPPTAAVLDEEFENDPAFALYHEAPPATASADDSVPSTELDAPALPHVDLLGGIESYKVSARYELVGASTEEHVALLAMRRIQRISANMENVMRRLEALTVAL